MSTNLGEHFRVIWRRRYRILAISVLIALAVYLRSASQPDRYDALLRLRLSPGQPLSGQLVGVNEIAFLASTYAELATAASVQAPVEEVAEEVGGDVGASVTVEASELPGFIDIRSSGPTPAAAEQLATAMSDALIATVEERQQEATRLATEPLEAQLAEIEAALDALDEGDDAQAATLGARYDVLLNALTERQLQSVDELEVISPAKAGTAPSSPSPLRNVLLAFLVAVVVNSELVVILAALGDRLSLDDLADDIQETAGVPLLASVPAGRPDDRREAFRELRTNLQFLSTGSGIRTLAVVGADPQVGKTMTSVALARSVSSTGLEVVLLDADLRRPSVHERLAMSRSPGLTELLRDTRSDIVRRAPPDEPATLRVATAGKPVADPSDLLSIRFEQVLEHLGAPALIVIDTAPINLFADALDVASQCDATIIVVDVRTARKRALQSSVARLRQVGANVVGVVGNRSANVPSSAYYDTNKAEVARMERGREPFPWNVLRRRPAAPTHEELVRQSRR